MENVKINRHNFENAKREIKDFSEKLPSNPYFERVQTDVFLGLFDHNVTGEELNEFIGRVQNHFISTYEVLRKTVKEFKSIYNALDSLDNDYIKGILISLDTATEASQQALDNQRDINRTIEALKKSVEALYSLRTVTTAQQEQIDQLLSNKNVITELINKLNKSIAEIDVFKEKMKDTNERLNLISQDTKNVKVAYVLAGVSITLTLIQLILLLLGII